MSDNLAVLQQIGEFPGQDKAPQVRRKLWDENATKSRLGEEGYAWFVECAERNLPKCVQCNGSGSVMMPDPIGLRRGLLVTTTCPTCSTYVENLTEFTKRFLEVVPRAYRHFTLRTLQPYPASPVPTERQAEVIAALKANPDKSYAFFAPAGAGKTVFATALFSKMLYRQYVRPHLRWNWFPVRRMSAKALLDQHSQWVNARHSEKLEPEVTSRKIVEATRAGQTYRLFLEDMNGEDSAARRAAAFDVLNTLHENEGQLVITSSLTVSEFKRQYGENLFWRIARHCTIIDFFSDKENN
jgi:hypothetical protein